MAMSVSAPPWPSLVCFTIRSLFFRPMTWCCGVSCSSECRSLSKDLLRHVTNIWLSARSFDTMFRTLLVLQFLGRLRRSGRPRNTTCFHCAWGCAWYGGIVFCTTVEVSGSGFIVFSFNMSVGSPLRIRPILGRIGLREIQADIEFKCV